ACRQRFPRRSVYLPAHRALRRLHVQPAAGALPHQPRQGGGRSDHQSRHGHRETEGDSGAGNGAFRRESPDMNGNLDKGGFAMRGMSRVELYGTVILSPDPESGELVVATTSDCGTTRAMIAVSHDDSVHRDFWQIKI